MGLRLETTDSAHGSTRRADRAARIAAGAVLGIGAFLIVVPAAMHLDDVWSDPFKPAVTTSTVTKATGDRVEVTTTRAEASRPFVERILAPGGLVLLRLGVLALAALLAGAVVQRIWLAAFALKLGPLEVPDLQRAAAASEQALDTITAELARQAEATEEALEGAAYNAEELAALGDEIARLLAVLQQIPGVELDPDSSAGEGEIEVRVQFDEESHDEA